MFLRLSTLSKNFTPQLTSFTREVKTVPFHPSLQRRIYSTPVNNNVSITIDIKESQIRITCKTPNVPVLENRPKDSVEEFVVSKSPGHVKEKSASFHPVDAPIGC